MEKRFVAFLAIAFAILLINSMLNPPKRIQKEKEDDNKQQVAQLDNQEKKPGEDDLPSAPEPDDPSTTISSTAQLTTEQSATGDNLAVEAPIVPAMPAVEQEWHTLGSLDPASGYQMAIIVTNRGANVRRLELSDPRFRDIEDRSGYLGHLAATDAPGGGAEIHVVVPGTPADQVGLKPGDVIKRLTLDKLGEQEIEDAESLVESLLKTKPRQEIEITYVRENAPAKTVQVTLTRRPLEVMRPEVENLKMRGVKIPDDFADPPSFRLTLEQRGEVDVNKKEAELPGVDLYEGMWEITGAPTPSSIEFRRVLPKLGLEVFKRYSLHKQDEQNNVPGYDFDLEVEFRNISNREQKIAYRLDGPTGLPVEGWWYSYKIGREWSTGIRDLFVQVQGRSPLLLSCKSIVNEDTDSMTDKSVLFAGIDAKYFSSILIPRKKDISDEWTQEVVPVRINPKPEDKSKITLANVTCRLISKPKTLGPNESLKHRYQIFAGPKRPELLAHYTQPIGNELAKDSLGELIYYGWPIWAGVARVMSVILLFLYGAVGNYGIAIIMLTLLVRACMFPLSKKQALNMIKMQEIQPQMKAIADKYKNDMEKRAKAQQELIRKNNYNPMGGCLMMFVQLPIFLGLYRSLTVDIELRDAPLFSEAIRWCSNLAAPDMLFNWSSFMPEMVMGYLGSYFNLLPILTVCLFLLQQKMFMPPPADDNAAMQQKIMKFMMLFMAFMFFKVASGLCLYFIVSSLWGICERKLLPKPPPKDATVAKSDTSTKKTSTSANGRSRTNQAARKKKKQRRK